MIHIIVEVDRTEPNNSWLRGWARLPYGAPSLGGIWEQYISWHCYHLDLEEAIEVEEF